MENEKPGRETLEQWHRDPQNWKWGIFYYNKEDKRLFPPKRLKGLGWTINFANPWPVFTFPAMTIFIVIILRLVNSR